MRSPTLQLRVHGPYACFTRPELKVERVSYPVMTPTAARGLYESVLWKPAICWHIQRIFVEREIKFTSFRRNEVNSKISAPPETTIVEGGSIRPFYADEDHTQRNTVALKDVQYVIEAYFEITLRAGSEDNVNKFVEIFQRRLERGQHFQQPYLGCREFIAEVMPVSEPVKPIKDNRDLGLMLGDIQYYAKGNRAVFFRAQLVNGALEIPEAITAVKK